MTRHVIVYGVESQGSKRLVRSGGRTLLADANPETRRWRDGLSAAMAAVSSEPLLGPVGVVLHVHVRRPKAHYRTGRHAHQLREDAPLWAASGKDLDKVARACGDAGTGIWWRDDRQVASWRIRRLYTEGPERVDLWAERLAEQGEAVTGADGAGAGGAA